MPQFPPELEENPSPLDGTREFPTQPGPFSPAGDYDAQQDLLDDAQELPALFPEEDDDAPAAEPDAPRPRKPKARKRLRVPIFLGKCILALVLALVVLVGGLLGYLTVTEYTPAYAELARRGANNIDAKLASNSLRLLTFNTGYGGLGDDADFFMDGGKGVNPGSQERVERNMLGIEQIVGNTDADIVLMQEVDTDSNRSFHLNQWLQYEYDLSEYETRFALNYSCDYVPYPLSERIGEVHSGVATYSRYDISSATRYSLPVPFSWPTRVANLKRCMLVTRIPLDGRTQELVVVNFHLEAYDDGEGNQAQFEQVMQLLQEEYAKGNYVIAGGDFNQSFPDSLTQYPIKSTTEWQPNRLGPLPADWRYAYDNALPTCRLLNQPYDPASEKTQYYVIDGFILSPNVTLDRVETLNEGFVCSDHNPVVLDVTLQ